MLMERRLVQVSNISHTMSITSPSKLKVYNNSKVIILCKLGSSCIRLGYTYNRYGLNLSGQNSALGISARVHSCLTASLRTQWLAYEIICVFVVYIRYVMWMRRIDNSVWEIENATGSDQWASWLDWSIPVLSVCWERGTSLTPLFLYLSFRIFMQMYDNYVSLNKTNIRFKSKVSLVQMTKLLYIVSHIFVYARLNGLIRNFTGRFIIIIARTS